LVDLGELECFHHQVAGDIGHKAPSSTQDKAPDYTKVEPGFIGQPTPDLAVLAISETAWPGGAGVTSQ
jgi:hypothetical protein